MAVEIRDMPKLQSPFVRKMIGGKYVVTPEITPGYEWVFTDETVMAIEKLDGTNVSIIIEDGVVRRVMNRMNLVMANGLRIENNKGTRYILDGVMGAIERGYVARLPDGQHFGELIGPKVGHSVSGGPDPYQLTEHVWIPFATYSREHLRYKSWGKYPKDYATMSAWFEKDLLPLFYLRVHGEAMKKSDAQNLIPYVEGIVFTHPDGRMAKLRRDMFDWYSGKGHGD
jgi:hypothetical protein